MRLKKISFLCCFFQVVIALLFLLFANKATAQKDSLSLKKGDIKIKDSLLVKISDNKIRDSLILKNGDIIVGEIKLLDRGVVTIETLYSENDFTIEWSGVKGISSKSVFLITLEDGTRYNGSLRTVRSKNIVVINTSDNKRIETTVQEIVFLKGLKSDFWNRADVTIDVGLTLTKANNLRQSSISAILGYLAKKWQTNLYYNDIRSRQDSVGETKNIQGGVSFKYFLQDDWYVYSSLDFFSNTEQALKLRTINKLGVGNYIVHSNKSYWGVAAGLSYNNESFTNETGSRNSLEGFAGSQVNIFDVGDLDFLSKLYFYPSITESGRFRTDFSLDTKYDLPLDFYIKLGVTINYDNRAAVAGHETDYIFSFSIGWELE
jgi:hypothetical protein